MIIIYILLSILFLLVLYFILKKNKNPYTKNDENIGQRALKELEESLKNGKEIPKVSDDELYTLLNDVYLVKHPNMIERLSYLPEANTRYWPKYYYSFPYTYKYGGAWPPGMYSRLYFWSPGFYSGSGWQYYLRPGISYKYWPRNRWIRHTKNGKNSYYYVTNRDDYTHNAANYKNLPIYKY